MKTAPVSEIKARLSEYLSRVKAGDEVTITERGKAVARIVPIHPRQRPRASLAGMEKKGLIRLGSGILPEDFWSMQRPPDPEGLVLKALIDERESER
jgi:prevent-host-death family protein